MTDLQQTRRDADREHQDIVTLVKRQLTREIAEGRFTANREAVKREVERRVKERMRPANVDGLKGFPDAIKSLAR